MAIILGRKGGGAAGGGSLPDPSGEPDGDVLTVSGGSAVWSPGGGSQPDPATFPRALYGGDAVAIGDGAQARLTWDTLGFGDDLFDRSGAFLDKPVVLVGGIYSITTVVTAVFAAFTAGGIGQAILHMDHDNEDAICENTMLDGNGDQFACVSLNNTYYIPAGGTVAVVVFNWDGAVSRNFKLVEAIVQLVVPDP